MNKNGVRVTLDKSPQSTMCTTSWAFFEISTYGDQSKKDLLRMCQSFYAGTFQLKNGNREWNGGTEESNFYILKRLLYNFFICLVRPTLLVLKMKMREN